MYERGKNTEGHFVNSSIIFFSGELSVIQSLNITECQLLIHVSKHNNNPISRVHCVFSLIFRGEIANYTFLEALISTESKNQCFHFF